MSYPNSAGTEPDAAGRLRAASDVIARTLGESAVLIRLSTNRIYELNATGVRVWDLVVKGATRDDIVAALQQEFEGDRVEISDAVDDLLANLRAEGLM
jgi:hypothetical protein